jgi:hypothetical protein
MTRSNVPRPIIYISSYYSDIYGVVVNPTNFDVVKFVVKTTRRRCPVPVRVPTPAQPAPAGRVTHSP